LSAALAALQWVGFVTEDHGVGFEDTDRESMISSCPSRPRPLAAFFVALSTFAALPVAGQICTWGGTPAAAAPTAGFLRSQSELLQAPGRLAVDQDSNLYVTDSTLGRLLVRNQLGRLIAARDGLDRPLAVAVDSTGGILVSELGPGTVSIFDSDWNLVDTLGSGAGEFLNPNDIAIDPLDGSILVSDGDAHLIKVYNPAGALLRTIGTRGSAAGQLESPTGVLVTAGGEVLVADQGNDRIQVFARDGTFLRCFGHQPGEARKFGRIDGLTVDSLGRIYVADGFQGHVAVFDDQGVPLTTLAAFGEGPGELLTPLGLAIDSSNRLFVTSHNSSRVEVFGIDTYADPTESASAGTIEFGAATFEALEGSGAATAEVTRTGGSAGLVMADVRSSDGSAALGIDYQPVRETIVFADGDAAAKSVAIQLRDDSVYEGDETVQLALSRPVGGAAIGAAESAELTVLEDDPPAPGILQLDSASHAGVERGGSLTVTVRRTAGSDGAVTVAAVVTGGSATPGDDYSPPSAVVGFADADVEPKSFQVTVLDDDLVEGDETIHLALSSPTGGATLGSVGSSVMTILDDDLDPVCPTDLPLANQTVASAEEFVAAVSINVGAAFRVAAPAGAATFRAGSLVSFADGLVVESGATVAVFVGPDACGGGG
jgi:sugar lactone lactonase YvrE